MREPSSYPQLMVVKEKYDDAYYYLNSREDLYRVAASLIRERASLGYYYEETVIIDGESSYGELERLLAGFGIAEDIARDSAIQMLKKPYEKATYSIDDFYVLLKIDPLALDALPDNIRDNTVMKLKADTEDANRFLKYSRMVQESARMLEQILTSTTPQDLVYTNRRGREFNMAYFFLYSRSDGEYEGYEFRGLREIPSEADFSVEDTDSNSELKGV